MIYLLFKILSGVDVIKLASVELNSERDVEYGLSIPT